MPTVLGWILIGSMVAFILSVICAIFLYRLSNDLHRCEKEVAEIKQYLTANHDLISRLANSTDLSFGRTEERLKRLEGR